MLEVFGWLAFISMALIATGCWIFVAAFSFGTYNIGGVINRWPIKVFMMALGLLICLGWYELILICPFNVSMK